MLLNLCDLECQTTHLLCLACLYSLTLDLESLHKPIAYTRDGIHYIMNSTEVQNPRRKLDDKCLCFWFCSCLCKVCSRVSEALVLTLVHLHDPTIVYLFRPIGSKFEMV